MHQKSPFTVILSRYITEKAKVLESLQHKTSNPCIKRCNVPKYVFLVDKRAGKREIAKAVEEIYRDKGITVLSVNTIHIKRKKRMMRGKIGFKAGSKKAIVTLKPGDQIDD